MSYDVSVIATDCCSAHRENITSNLRPMFAEADLDLREVGGERAQLVGLRCLTAVEEMRREPDRFKAHDPENGWGDYDGAVGFLVRLARHCMAHPDGVVEVSW